MAISNNPLPVSGRESSSSAVHWAPIFAGALVAASITLVLGLVGSGLGLSIASPWASAGASATTVAVSGIVWLIVMQWLSAGLGGYLTGRLRTKWSDVHSDEIYFRDTAHGFLSWALTTVVVFGVLGSTIFATASSGLQAVSNVTSGVASTAMTAAAANSDGSSAYVVDTLFRPSPNAPAGQATSDDSAEAQALRILANGVSTGTISPDDRTYLVSLVASRAGLSTADAEARIDAVMKRIDDAKVAAQQAADTARKAAATAALVGALSMMIGAFIASVAAVIGGRQRDDENVVYLGTR